MAPEIKYILFVFQYLRTLGMLASILTAPLTVLTSFAIYIPSNMCRALGLQQRTMQTPVFMELKCEFLLWL